ncbi:hypothetical protein KI688_002403 [Linnemannia hyalina]|uniref:Uncharacterized protein n=1 Tax=Linnemannia hyalina TaxID=64524 RepID=A0A9P8BTL3_9FUNG|nr:hypothetical protein KI688_002403 [Linnemannia hyalina]
MSSISTHTTAASHSHTLAPGPVITSSLSSAQPTSIVSSSNIPPFITGTTSPGGSGSSAAPTPTAKPSSASSTYTQKKVSLVLALMVFLPAVINAL